MKILALDTCFDTCSVTLLIDGSVHITKLEERYSMQAERLLLMIEELLSEANLIYSDLDYISVTIGPGGFTGVRIGLAAAYGICIVSKIPLIYFSTLEVVAFESEYNTKKFPLKVIALNASFDKFYCQSFISSSIKNTIDLEDQFKSIMEPCIVDIDFLNEVAQRYEVFGNYSLYNRSLYNSEPEKYGLKKVIMPTANGLALLSYEKIINDNVGSNMIDFANRGDIKFIEPIYLRSFI